MREIEVGDERREGGELRDDGLAELDERLLGDVDISLADRQTELAKPFWRE